MNHIENIQNNPLKSVFILSMPIILTLFLQTFYSLVDTYWISGLGQDAIIAMGYVFNIWYLIQKLGESIGRLCNVLISNSIGAGNYEKANNIACHGLIIILFLSIFLPIIFLLLIKPVCILGHLEPYFNFIYDYFIIVFIFIGFVLLTNYFSAILGSEGIRKEQHLLY